MPAASAPERPNLRTKDLVSAFRNPSWSSEQDAERFATDSEPVEHEDVVRVLEALVSEGARSEATLQRRRCLAFAGLVEKDPDRRLFRHFVRALRRADGELRSHLVRLLPKVNSPAEHGELCALLRSADPAVRALAAEALSRLGAKTAFEMLAEMVREPSFPGRNEAIGVLVAIGEHRAVPALESVLRVGTSPEKTRAIDQLCAPRCMARDPAAALRAIVVGLDDLDQAVVNRAIWGISQLASEDDFFGYVGTALESANVSTVQAVVKGLRLFPSPRAVEALRHKLQQGPNKVRLAALDSLEAIGTGDVLTPLVEGLSQRRLAVRVRAGEALAHLAQSGAVDLARTIVWLLRSRDVDVRRMAVELAQSVREHSAELWPKLLAFLKDEDWWVRERVADALVQMAGRQLAPHLVACLQDDSATMRRFALEVLTRLDEPNVLGAVIRAAREDADWLVRERAIEAAAQIGDARAVPYLVDVMLRNADLQVACLHALARLGAKTAAAHVASLLGSADADVRAAALRCLRSIDDPTQSQAVRLVVKDPRTEVRGLARELLEQWAVQSRQELAAVEIGDLSPLDRLLIAMARMDAEDLILAPDRRPCVKRFGKTWPLAKNMLRADQVRSLIVRLLSPEQTRDLEARREVDLSHEVPAEGLRFRMHVFEQLGGTAAVFRIIKGSLPELESLGLPAVVGGLGDLKNGLVLVGGPTGSGKSTTLAALIDYINRTSKRHIVTFEDPIEVRHARKNSLVNQRELGTHTGEFGVALRATLRQDPDVILVGEMRDPPTIAFAVTAAETGHLVFGTIHTVSAAMTVDRLINAFPSGQHEQVRSILAGSLRAVVCQFLHRRRDAPGRCLSVEVMLNNDAIANLIRKGKSFQIPTVIATSREQGMQLMDVDLMRLVREGAISAEDAYVRAASKAEFEALLPEQPGQD